jgi:hypothetical protein
MWGLGPPERGGNRGIAVRIAAKVSLLGVAFGLGACAMPDTDSFKAPTAAALFRPTSVVAFRDRVLPAVAPEDLVNANGQCAGAGVAATENGEPVPMVPAAIALEMSECDVVKRAGTAERVEIGANERRERTATLTYTNGQRPGIYSFTAGRLTALERAPEPVAQPKSAKKPAKPVKRTARPSQVSVQ